MQQVYIKLYKNTIVSGQEIATSSIFNGDVALERELESDEMFYRDSVDGTFTFTNDVYDIIEGSSLDDKFYMVLYYDSLTPICTGTFTKTQCTFDEDNKICVVNSLRQFDKYSKILAGIDNKYNLVELAPAANTIYMKKRAILQICVAGDTKVTNIIGNMSYEVNTQMETNYQNLTDCHFEMMRSYRLIQIPSGTKLYYQGNQVDIGGIYYEDEISADEYKWWRTDNEYYIYYMRWDTNSWYGYVMKGNVELTVANAEHADGLINEADGNGHAFTLADYNLVGGNKQYTGATKAFPACQGVTFYARILSDLAGSDNKLPANDICENNLNYRYWYALGSSMMTLINNSFIRSLEVQVNPTPYGKNEDGLYFVKPTPSDPTDNIIALGWSRWVPESYWIETKIYTYLEVYDATFSLNDAYEIKNCILLLAKQIDPSINGVVSTIIDSSTAIGSIGYPSSSKMFITPISNIKKTYYDTAAQRGNITLGEILGMLKKCFKFYWFIDSNNNIRIEHILYFLNGGGYSAQTGIDICDTTAIKAPMVNRPWAFGTNKYDYETGEVRKRYEFSWATQETEQFNGYPLNINNSFCEEMNTETINVDNFAGDIDYIVGSPNSIDDDLYAVMITKPYLTRDMVVTGDSQIISGTPIYRIQNRYCSFIYTANESKIRMYDIDGDDISANELDISSKVEKTKRIRRQHDVTFPVADWTKAFNTYVTTGYGTCQIQKVGIALESKMATANLIIP